MPDRCMQCDRQLQREPKPDYVSVTFVKGQTRLVLGEDWFLFCSTTCMDKFSAEVQRLGYYVRKDSQ